MAMLSNRWHSVAVGLVALGCGYHLAGPSHPLGPEVDRIQIRPLDNRTSAPGVERLLGDALVEEFARRGQLQPVYSRPLDGSGVVLGGVIQEVSIRPVAFSSVSLALEYEIGMVVALDVVHSGSTAPVWDGHRVELKERFLGSADPGVHESNKEEALQRMAGELAGRVHDVLVQAF
jgi:hypothetical protein